MMGLEILAEKIKKCKKCRLYKGRKKAVPGEGPKKAKYFFVGEAPGHLEDVSGKPFFGRAGEVLNEALLIANLKREKLFITSCVKCRPPDNRNPKVDEINACKDYLLEQIKLVEPKIIVLLGRIAAKTLLGKKDMKKLHGKFFEKDGQKYFVTYHPAAALRSTATKSLFFKDMEKLR